MELDIAVKGLPYKFNNNNNNNNNNLNPKQRPQLKELDIAVKGLPHKFQEGIRKVIKEG
jgi:hypothetical protein